MIFNIKEFAGIDFAGLELPNGFEHVLDLDIFAVERAGQDGSSVDEYGGNVESGHRHHSAGE